MMKIGGIIMAIVVFSAVSFYGGWSLGTSKVPTLENSKPVSTTDGLSKQSIVISTQHTLDGQPLEELSGTLKNVIQNSPQTLARRDLIRKLIRELAQKDPKSALTAFSSLSFADRKAACGEMIRGWIIFDRVSAWNWFQTHAGDSEIDNNTLTDVTRAFGEKDPQWVLDRVASLGSYRQPAALAGVFASFDRPEQFESLAARFLPPGKIQSDRLSQEHFFSRWAEAFPDKAVEYVKNNINTIPASLASRADVISAIMGGLTAIDPTKAMAICATFSPPFRDLAQGDSLQQWARQGNPVAVGEWAASSDNAKAFSSEALAQLGRKVASDDPSLALKIAAKIDHDPEVKQELVEASLQSLAQHNLKEAMKIIGSQLAPNKIEEAYVSAVLAGGGDGQESADVLDAVRSIPSQATRDSAAFALAMKWTQSNPSAVVSFLQNEPSISQQMRKNIIDFLRASGRYP